MDTLQLVDDQKVRVYTLKKGINDTILYDEKKVVERFGFLPKFLPDYKGLRGDPSDNIIGIKGIGEKTAEDIKIAVGAALPDIDEPPQDYIVRGPNIMTSLPIEIPISYQEIAYCLDKSLSKVEAAMLNVLEQTPPELYADIVNKGIYLTGGGALLRGLDRRLSDKLNINFNVAEDPLHAVARGTGVALKNVDKFPFLMR